MAKDIEEKTVQSETKEEYKKLVFYIVIVDFGQSENIIRILKDNHSSAQFVQMGEGTANSQIRDILNIEDNNKEIIYSLIREDYAKDICKELSAYFAASKRNKGVGFSIDLDSFVGVTLYKFFTQTVRG